ncbi:isochorismate synthase [Gordonia malaquae]|uniref:isochorismate synthase n=1 Tax=Gordonia malaquae NBRC 108250 TaxID=1223542 RepID=M3USN8_GORML|nr:isochorismate synthase [Gordonia malaquae]GAC78262.1 putative isochorismate synthase [Gordonia malaquae NBRC 108250]SEE00596.1 isochorismate synthase [Gordonia malaquae]
MTAAMRWRSASVDLSASALLSEGPAALDHTRFAQSMQAAAADAHRGRVFAALPFRRDQASTIVLPIGPEPERRAIEESEFRDGGQSSPDDYRDGVRLLLEAFADGDVEKAVLARYRDLSCTEPCDPLAIAGRLAADNPAAYVFALPVADGRHLVGASPELLIAKSGTSVRSHPLAGSARRSPDSATDRARADALTASEKDRREHAYVVDAICDVLAPYCARLSAPEPGLLGTDSMWHLGTEITAELRDPELPVGELAALLHPTPAVCGTPRMAAYDLISEAESFDRGFFAGAVGWSDAHGDGEWAVSIRCGDVWSDRIRAYAGAGIVVGSEPDAELAETSGKLSTFLAAVST